MQKHGAASPADDCERGAEQSDGAKRTVFADVKWRRRDDRHGFCAKNIPSQIPSLFICLKYFCIPPADQQIPISILTNHLSGAIITAKEEKGSDGKE